MKVGSQTTRQIMYSCAIHGAIAWTVYAIVECWFLIIFPWILKPSYDYVQFHWAFTVLVSVSYPIVGLILGGLSGFCFNAVARRFQFVEMIQPTLFCPAIATLTVLLAFDLNIIINSSGSITLSELPSLCISLLLASGLVLSTKSKIWGRRLRCLVNPWTVSIVLLGIPWIINEFLSSYSRTAIAAGTLAYSFSIFLISFIIKMVAEKHSIKRSYPAQFADPTRSLVFLM